MSQNLNLKSPASSEDQLMKFLQTSQDLLTLVQHENAILLKDGVLSFEAYIARKVDLMQGFEKEAQNLLNTISVEKSSPQAQAVLVEEIKRIKDALHINSVHQIQMLRKQTMQKANSFNAPAAAEMENVCH